MADNAASLTSRYERMREQYRPLDVRVLLIGESAPDPLAGELRFFYAPRLAAADNLFRSVVAALYGVELRGMAGTSKRPLLERLRDDGVFLIDLVPYPVNHLSARARAQALRDNAVETVRRAADLQPEGIVVCHGPTFRALRQPLTAAGLPLLHQQPLPFPLGNWRARFVAGVREAVRGVGWATPA